MCAKGAAGRERSGRRDVAVDRQDEDVGRSEGEKRECRRDEEELPGRAGVPLGPRL